MALLESEDLAGGPGALVGARSASDPVIAAIATVIENSMDFFGGGSIPPTSGSHAWRTPTVF